MTFFRPDIVYTQILCTIILKATFVKMFANFDAGCTSNYDNIYMYISAFELSCTREKVFLYGFHVRKPDNTLESEIDYS